MNDSGAFRIGDHAIEPRRGRIVSGTGEVHVEPRVMDVLVALARRAGETVSRDDLIESVWKHPYVSDEALSHCISMLRRALGDDRAHPRYLETIPKRGYRLVAPVEIADSGPLPECGSIGPPDWSKTNLALQPTPIIGRESELAEVRTLLAARRLVTLTGGGGVGKTRLALEVGSQSVHDFADGVWLVELAPVSDPQLIPGMVAAAVGIELGHAKTLKALVQGISRRQVLLILDNCEHLIDAAAALVEAILGAAPGVHLLTTSQMLIRVGGEQAYPVSSLTIPGEEHVAADQVISAAAVQLFVERAKLADPHFRLVDRNAPAVAAICRRLEGIPLAIEMAAARAPMLGVEQLAELLDERFRVLTGGRRTALPRHQTLRATLDWSYGFLSEHERAVFNRLAVFAGGFTLDAVSAIASDDVIDKIEAVDTVAQLIARSLVVAEPNPAAPRYRLLETTRAYALERLTESGDGVGTRARHLAFYLALAETAMPELLGSNQAKWFAQLDLERDNFLAARAWCGHEERGAEASLRLASALRHYWIHRGGLELGYRMTVEALERAPAQERSQARCRGLSAAAVLASCMGQYAEAQGYLEEGLSIAREIGDDASVAKALWMLGDQLFAQGRLPEARRHIEEALPVARWLKDKSSLSTALLQLAELDRLEGNLETAEPLYEESLALARELGDLRLISIGLLDLAMVSVTRGSRERAPEMLLEALALIEQVGSKAMGTSVLGISAGLAASVGEWDCAARLNGAADAQMEQLGMHRETADEALLAPLIAKARNALGTVAFAAGEAAGRAMSYETAWSVARTWLQESRLLAGKHRARSGRRPTTTPCAAAVPSGSHPRETRARPRGPRKRRSGR